MKLITPFLKIQNQLRIFHWQTTSYAQHKAFGKAYEHFDELVDQFVEVYTGKYGRTKASIKYNIELTNYSNDYLQVIDTFTVYLVGITDELSETDTDLLNIRDEMLGSLNRLKYLLSLT